MANTVKSLRIYQAFGVRLRAVRIAAGYPSSAQFAACLGVNVPRYRKYERGESLPPPDVLEKIVDLTGKTLDFLILGRIAAKAA